MSDIVKEKDGVKYIDQGDDNAVDKLNTDLEKLIREQRDKKKAQSFTAKMKRALLSRD